MVHVHMHIHAILWWHIAAQLRVKHTENHSQVGQGHKHKDCYRMTNNLPLFIPMLADEPTFHSQQVDSWQDSQEIRIDG